MDLISVIVPVYNVEKYLDKCIESIVNQTYKNLEIILVDDGSPDNSGAICDAWAEKDDRIIVIHKENEGSGKARNVALDLAKGEFIAFVDSDDYIDCEMYSHLYSLISSGADIAECNYELVFDDNFKFDNFDDTILSFTTNDAICEHIQDRYFKQIIWNKLYKRDIIGNIRFPIGTKIDDEYFTYKVLGNAKKLIHSKKVCYAYRQQYLSIMHSLNSEHYLQALRAKELRHNYICSKFPTLKKISLFNLWFSCIYVGQILLNNDKQVDINFFNSISEIIKKYPIKLSLDMGTSFIWLLIAKFSIKFACRLRNFLRIGL